MANKISKAEAQIKFIRLGWEILEHKFRYYHGEEYGLKPVNDAEYDKLESLYKRLAVFLKLESTASNHVGFPIDTPSGRLVMSKLTNGKHLRLVS